MSLDLLIYNAFNSINNLKLYICFLIFRQSLFPSQTVPQEGIVWKKKKPKKLVIMKYYFSKHALLYYLFNGPDKLSPWESRERKMGMKNNTRFNDMGRDFFCWGNSPLLGIGFLWTGNSHKRESSSSTITICAAILP